MSMIHNTIPHVAVFREGGPDAADDARTWHKDVLAWGAATGRALVVSDESSRAATASPGKLHPASDDANFIEVRPNPPRDVAEAPENVPAPKYVSMVPGAPWRIARKDSEGGLDTSLRLVAWALREDGRLVPLGPSGPAEDVEGFSHVLYPRNAFTEAILTPDQVAGLAKKVADRV
jgi:hypothetical protein